MNYIEKIVYKGYNNFLCLSPDFFNELVDVPLIRRKPSVIKSLLKFRPILVSADLSVLQISYI